MKFHAYASLCSVILSTSLFAADKSANCCPEVCEEEILFPHYKRVFTNLEFLFWTAEESPLDYAIRMEDPAWGSSPAFASGDYKIAAFNWEPGLRVAVGFYNEPRLWEVIGQYTWILLHGKNHSDDPSASDEFLEATWNEITPPPLSRATSHIDLHYHVGDLFISRVFDPNPHLRLKLLGGGTLAFIEQSWKVNYFDFSTNHDHIKNKWRFCGGGFRTGLFADWFWGFQHLYLTGKMTIAALLGTYKNTAFQTTTFNPGGTNNPNIPIRNSTYDSLRFTFNSQFLLGPSYQQMFDCWDIEIFAGYEFNLWLNLHEIYRSSQSAPGFAKETNLSSGMLGLHGLTVRLTIGF